MVKSRWGQNLSRQFQDEVSGRLGQPGCSVGTRRWGGAGLAGNNIRISPLYAFIKVGPIPVEDGIGKEVVVVYKTEIRSNGTFFTDSNGRQLVERKRGERWEYIG